MVQLQGKAEMNGRGPGRGCVIIGDVRQSLPRARIAATLGVCAVLAAVACGCGGDAPSTGAAASPVGAPQTDGLVHHPRAVDQSAGVPSGRSGVVARESATLPRPKSDAEIRRELAASGIPSGATAALTSDGLAVAPLAAPAVVQAVIQAGNQIARLPYRYGGGHATWIDTAYDCSASISFRSVTASFLCHGSLPASSSATAGVTTCSKVCVP